MDSIKLCDKVYDRQAFLNAKKLKFTELFIKNQSQTNVPTIEEFFELYNQLFYIIPKEGDNSHTQLIAMSGEYLGINTQESLDVSTLLDEITSLREQLYNYESLSFELSKNIPQ